MKNYTWILTAFALAFGCTATGDPASSTQSALRTCYEEGDPSCFDGIESPEPYEIYEVCFDEHIGCLEAGGPECDVLLDACFGVYDETGDPADAIAICYADGEACARDTGDDELCFEMLSSCFESLDEPTEIGEAPNVAEVCFEGHLACIELMEDPAECDFLLDECIITACPPDQPVEPTDPCIEAVEHCIETAPDSEDPALCIEIIDGCYGEEPQVPACEEEFFTCLESSDFEDPAVCEPLLWICDDEAPPAPPEGPCLEEFNSCLESGTDYCTCEPILDACEASEPSEPSEPGEPGEPSEPSEPSEPGERSVPDPIDPV